MRQTFYAIITVDYILFLIHFPISEINESTCSEARDIGRHYASRSAKCKEKMKRNQHVIWKLRKLYEFFNIVRDGAESTEITSHCALDEHSAIKALLLSILPTAIRDDLVHIFQKSD